MDHLPLFLDLRDQPVVLVGGGEVAERKLRLLLSAGARATVVAPQIVPGVARLLRERGGTHRPSRFVPEDLDGARLVIAATDDRDVNAQVSAAAQQRGLWVNVVDDPALSTALMPSIVDRSPVIVAISTGGTSPVLARRLRTRLESLLEPSLGALAALLARWRTRLIARWPDPAQRRRAVDALLDGELPAVVARGTAADADAALQTAFDAIAGSPEVTAAGRVTLVGAGPGDPGLLTLKGLQALQRADVVLHDRLVSAEVLGLARRDATCVEVGKTGGGPSTPQDDIHLLMLEYARRGLQVVRLKGGDPFVFGRGAEELEVLRAAGIACDVVPGITTALALAAAGIPLTHRSLSAGVRLVTAQRAADGSEPDWENWARSRETLVVYMGTSRLGEVRRELLRHGLDPRTPVALVERVSLPTQRVLTGTLETVERLAHAQRVGSPSIAVIGPVAALAVAAPPSDIAA